MGRRWGPGWMLELIVRQKGLPAPELGTVWPSNSSSYSAMTSLLIVFVIVLLGSAIFGFRG